MAVHMNEFEVICFPPQSVTSTEQCNIMSLLAYFIIRHA